MTSRANPAPSRSSRRSSTRSPSPLSPAVLSPTGAASRLPSRLGLRGVQVGTAYLWCPEARISAPHRAALQSARDDGTAVTNLMTGRPARGIVNRVMRESGPMSDVAPEFPLAAGALAPLRAKAQARGSGDFSPMWAGQAAALSPTLPAGELTRKLASDALACMRSLTQDNRGQMTAVRMRK